MSVVMLTRRAVLSASRINKMFLSPNVAIPAVSCLLSGTVASGFRDLTYISMLGSWTAETGSVEPPIQRARILLDFSCFSLDQSSSFPFLFLATAAPAKLSSRELDEVDPLDPGLGGVIRASAADLEQLGELDESTTFWRVFSSRVRMTL